MIGLSATDIKTASVWEFNAQMAGWSRQFEASGLSEAEKDDLWDWLQSKDDVPLAHRKPH